MLATSLYFGGWDFADGRPASYEALKAREYHHVFPDALLQAADINSYLALNCALITWKTNRSIGRKDPLEYLKDRVEWADEETVSDRLRTHLIDYDMLAKATYTKDSQMLEGDALRTVLQADFDAYLDQRAKLAAKAAAVLAIGQQPTLAMLAGAVDQVLPETVET